MDLLRLSENAVTTAKLNMVQDGLFHFVLAADNGTKSSSANVNMTVYDQNGNVVLSLDATTGQPPVSAAVYLLTGTYTIRYSVTTTSGAYFPVAFWLDGEILSDPIGPYMTTTTNSSTSGSPPPSGGYTYGGSSSTNTSTSSPPTYY